MRLHYPPEYVLDNMQMYEARIAMKYQHYAYKDNWEQARFIAYLIAQVNSKRHLSCEDIVKFSWDNESVDAKETHITKEDINRLKEKAQAYFKTINEKQ